MSELKAIVRNFMHDQERSESWVAEKMGISRSALNGWWTRGRTSPPEARLLHALSETTRTPYRDVLDAALVDFGYLPEEGSGYGAQPAQKRLEDVQVVEAEPLKAPQRKPAKRRTSPSDKP